MKHIKLFESFVNEELSPELKKRTYDAMIKIAKDPNAIDNLKRRNQADNVMKSLSPAVEKLRKELEGHAKRAIAKSTVNFDAVYKVSSDSVGVELDDYGLGKGTLRLYVRYKTFYQSNSILSVLICKDKYETSYGAADNYSIKAILSDRAFVNTLKKLIVQIQNDEIPGDDPVPAQPESLTPQGNIDEEIGKILKGLGFEPKEDVISKFGTGGDRGNFSGLPSQDTEAGQIARGR